MKKDKNNPGKKKKKWPILLSSIILLAGLIYLFREPIIEKASSLPVIGNLSAKKEEQQSIETLKKDLTRQEQELGQLKQELAALQETNESLRLKNDGLKQYEAMYTDFMKQKEEWDEEIAKTSPDLFIEQFEQVYPDTAERIYRILKGEEILNDEQRRLASTIAAMEADAAAAAVEQLLKTDAHLVNMIFESMSKDAAAAVLNEISAPSAAQIIKLISPDEALNQ